jgi:hypothetical protein
VELYEFGLLSSVVPKTMKLSTYAARNKSKVFDVPALEDRSPTGKWFKADTCGLPEILRVFKVS